MRAWMIICFFENNPGAACLFLDSEEILFLDFDIQ